MSDMMKVQRALQFKIIEPNQQKALSLNQTMRRYKKCLNFYLHELAKLSSDDDSSALARIYTDAKRQYKLPTGLIQTCRDVAKEQLKSYRENEDNPHFPHFRGLTTARYDKRTISFRQTDGHYKLWANIATVNGRVRVPITSCDEYVSELLGRDFLSAQLIYRKGEFYLNVIFEDTVKIPKEKELEHFIGIDRGSHNNLATVVVQDRAGNILESKFYSAKPMLEKRRRFREVRRSLGEAKQPKGIKKLGHREHNYIQDMNHKISTDIIRLASKYPNAAIVLENLTGIRKSMKWGREGNKKGHSWPFKELENMLEYKAHRNGIAVRRVHPRGTSSVCRNCFGPIRRSPSIQAVCISCKKLYNADWLGAVNITRRLFYYMLTGLGRSESGPEQSIDEPMGIVTAPASSATKLVASLAVS